MFDILNEIAWRRVPVSPGSYSARYWSCPPTSARMRVASRAFSLGNSMGKKTSMAEKLMSYTIDKNGCHIWSKFKDKDGYGQISIARNKSGRAHRESYKHYIGQIPDGMFVCHKCDNPSCINPNHLFVGTVKDNAKDRKDKGRNPNKYGINHHMAKLSEEEVLLIRLMKNLGASSKFIAKQFELRQSHVCSIISRAIWSHI